MVGTLIITERDFLSHDDAVAEGSWRSPSHATMNLRKPRAVASDSSLSGTLPFCIPGVHGKSKCIFVACTRLRSSLERAS
jgi:hypothetical protein